ncbi:hypothetical protein WDJ51_14535 [Rathayibacter sp. YIM 133350]|uniref:hypothetical protein n=1 Tax=Rathayibacter sp. YIM 133350 TaxID=3131992 RepID=UPI00307D38CF
METPDTQPTIDAPSAQPTRRRRDIPGLRAEYKESLAVASTAAAIFLTVLVVTHWSAITADPPHLHGGKILGYFLGSPVFAVLFVVMHVRARRKLKARNERDGTDVKWWVT